MSAFRSSLVVEYINGHAWLLVAPLVYDSSRLARTLIVPTGFLTDFTSVPWGLRNTFPKTDYGPAAVVHDYLYRYEYSITRAQADAVFREALGVLGASRLRRTLYYLAVRAGGWAVWKKGEARDPF